METTTLTREQALLGAASVIEGFDSPARWRNDAPETFDVGNAALLQFGVLTDPIPVLIRAVHIYNNKHKYDISLFIPKEDERWHETRLYNVDSDYISSVKPEQSKEPSIREQLREIWSDKK